MEYINSMLDFISASPSPFHRVENICRRLENRGYTRLYGGEAWKLEKGGKYYTVRNLSSVIAFRRPAREDFSINIVASHCDSPTFKLKENPQLKQGAYISLNTERYGGMIMSSWLDRPLSVAGRVVVAENGACVQKLVNVNRDLLVIPNVAIHMDRSVNDGKKFNPQTDMLPLYSLNGDADIMDEVARAAGCDKGDILGHDLYLYLRGKGCVFGAEEEFVSSAKLDDLQCVYSSMEGFLQREDGDCMPVLAVFDNEEVGSGTKQGAASTFLFDTLERVCTGLFPHSQALRRALSRSFMISADNAHAVHPNRASLADPTNRPVVNGGVVIKYNANQKYTTDAVSAALFKSIVNSLGLKWQTFANRSDMLGGSTLGNISNTKVPLDTVDIGLPQLAMHSAFETAGVKDTEDFVNICRRFFSVGVKKQGDDTFTIG